VLLQLSLSDIQYMWLLAGPPHTAAFFTELRASIHFHLHRFREVICEQLAIGQGGKQCSSTLNAFDSYLGTNSVSLRAPMVTQPQKSRFLSLRVLPFHPDPLADLLDNLDFALMVVYQSKILKLLKGSRS
jgi:hypothetical protein